MSIKQSTLQEYMLDKDIDPPAYNWDIFDDLPKDMDWLDDHKRSREYDDWFDDIAREYEDNEAAALHNYECKVYNELNRRTRI